MLSAKLFVAGSAGSSRLPSACSGAKKMLATLRRKLFWRRLETFVDSAARPESRPGALEDEEERHAASFATPRELSPAWVAEGRENCEAVRRAVNSLPIELRQVVVMKEFEELTFREISEALDIPLSTVKSRLYTALRQLQMRLQKFGTGPV